MNTNTALFLFLFSFLTFSNALAVEVNIISSTLDLDNGELTINADLADFNHTSSSFDYSISFGAENSSNSESASNFSSPTTFNGVVLSNLSPSCGSGIEVLVKEVNLNTASNELEIVALACNFTGGTVVSDWNVNASVFNSDTLESASDSQPLQNLIDSAGGPTPISFDSFDQVKLALDDGSGSLTIEATVSDLAFAANDEVDVSVNLSNSDNNESASGDATAIAADADSAAFSGPAGDCSAPGSNLIVEDVAIATDGAQKTISIVAKACNFTHDIEVQNAAAWSVVLGVESGSQSGSAQSGVLEFKFTSSTLVEELNQKIASVTQQIQSLNKRISAHNKTIKKLSSKVTRLKKRINDLKRRIKKSKSPKRLVAQIKRLHKRVDKVRKQIDNTKRSIKNLRDQVDELQSRKNELVDKRDRLKAKRDEASN